MSDTTAVQSFLDCFSKGDIEGAIALLHDDIRIHEPAGLPTGGEYRGKEGFMAFIQKVGATYEVQIQEARVLDAGDVSLAMIKTSWKSLATGAHLDMNFCELYTVEDGLITDLDVYPQDTKALSDITAVSV